MSPKRVPFNHKTGCTLVEALNLAECQIAELEWYAGQLGGFDDRLNRMLGEYTFPERLAEYRFTRDTLDYADDKRIVQACERVVFHLLRAGFSDPDLFFGTTAYRDGLIEKVRAAQVYDPDCGKPPFNDVPFDLFEAVVDEAILDHVLNPDTEIRRCAMCATWFGSEYRGRGRFCSDDCRKRFGNLVRDDAEFSCALGPHGFDDPPTEYAGLDYIEPKDQRPRLQPSGWVKEGARVCVHCASEKFPQWRRYIAPALNSSEKAAAS